MWLGSWGNAMSFQVFVCSTSDSLYEPTMPWEPAGFKLKMIRQSISINPISSTNNYQRWASTSWCLASKLDSKFVSDHNIAKPIADAICKTHKDRTSYVKLTKAARRFQHIKFTTNCLLRVYSKDCDHNYPYVKYTYAQKHLTLNRGMRARGGLLFLSHWLSHW